MNDNNLDALLGLGILGAMIQADKEARKSGSSDPDAMKKRLNAVYGANSSPEMKKEMLKRGAESAKAIYDSYVDAGFNEVQAFELLKIVLTHKN